MNWFRGKAAVFRVMCTALVAGAVAFGLVLPTARIQ